MKIDFFVPYNKNFTIDTLYSDGVGGSEYALLNLAECFALEGFHVTIYNDVITDKKINGVMYKPKRKFDIEEKRDIFVLFREPPPFNLNSISANVKIFWSCDQFTIGNWNESIFPFVDYTVTLSEYHKEYLSVNYEVKPHTIKVIPCLIRFQDYNKKYEKEPFKLLYCSMPNRGLEIILRIFPRIKEIIKEVKLFITGDFSLWGLPYTGMEDYKELLNQKDIIPLGKVKRTELVYHQLTADILAYPCIFPENFCISAVESQYAGCIPVVLNHGALSETVLTGSVIDGNYLDSNTIKRYLNTLIKLLKNRNYLKKLQEKSPLKIEKNFGREIILKKWISLFSQKQKKNPKRKIAVFRGPNLNYWETQNLRHLSKNYEIHAYYISVAGNGIFSLPFKFFKMQSLPESEGLYKDIENINFDDYQFIYTADITWGFSYQLSKLKELGLIKGKILALQWENIPFAYEEIKGVKEQKKETLKNIDGLLAVSKHSSYAQILEGCDEDKIYLLKMGIDENLFFPVSPDEKKYLRIKKGIDEDKFVILTVCRLVWEKGIYDILYAIKLFLRNNKDYKNKLLWIIIGSGPEKNNLYQRAIELGLQENIFILEGISYLHIHEYFKLADLFIIMSLPVRTWQEQFGMVIAESMACKLPVIAANSGSIGELFGKGIELVPSGDYLQLYLKIQNLLSSPTKLKKVAEKGFKLFNKEFSSRKFAKRLENILSSLNKVENIKNKILELKELENWTEIIRESLYYFLFLKKTKKNSLFFAKSLLEASHFVRNYKVFYEIINNYSHDNFFKDDEFINLLIPLKTDDNFWNFIDKNISYIRKYSEITMPLIEKIFLALSEKKYYEKILKYFPKPAVNNAFLLFHWMKAYINIHNRMPRDYQRYLQILKEYNEGDYYFIKGLYYKKINDIKKSFCNFEKAYKINKNIEILELMIEIADEKNKNKVKNFIMELKEENLPEGYILEELAKNKGIL